mgnify:FL=1|tara:strand:- start:11949 stop:12218 length:270 start_codon:yes stop_codon:yes gene_type:complete
MSNKEHKDLNSMSGDNNKGGSPLSQLDYDKSILELKLRKETLQSQIIEIDQTLEYLIQQRDEIVKWKGNNVEEIYRDIVGMEYWDTDLD